MQPRTRAAGFLSRSSNSSYSSDTRFCTSRPEAKTSFSATDRRKGCEEPDGPKPGLRLKQPSNPQRSILRRSCSQSRVHSSVVTDPLGAVVSPASERKHVSLQKATQVRDLWADVPAQPTSSTATRSPHDAPEEAISVWEESTPTSQMQVLQVASHRS